MSYDYKNKKIHNKYGKEKGSYYSIIVHKSNSNIELMLEKSNLTVYKIINTKSSFIYNVYKKRIQYYLLNCALKLLECYL